MLLQFYPQIRRGGGISETTDETNNLGPETDDNVDNSDGENDSSDASSGDSPSDGGEVNANASDYWYSYISSFTISSSSINYISTAGELAYLAYMVNSGNTYSGYVFQLTADIDLSDHYWVPIGGHEYDNSATNTDYYFAGEFDGNGHVITGLTTYNDGTSVSDYMGLFGIISRKLIHDIRIEDSEILGRGYVGAIAGYCKSSSYIYNCYNSGNVESTLYYVGGIVGYADSNANIYNCYNLGTVVASSSSVGGIVGYVRGGNSIYNCYNSGSVSGSTYTGGIVGQVDSSTSIYNCYNLGNVTSSSNDIGGIVGYIGNSSEIYNCYNSGIISGSQSVAGIVGYSSRSSDIHDCYNTGDVSGSSNYVGGVVGFAYYSSYIYNCYNTADITGVTQVGGVVGRLSYSSGSSVCYLSNCFNIGDVTATNSTISAYKYVGGVAGYLCSSTATFCYYCGTITFNNTIYEQGALGVSDGSGVMECLSDLESLAQSEDWYTNTENWDSAYSWDFDTVWRIVSWKNDSYPILSWQSIFLYDDDGDYWYIENGYAAQSVCDEPSGVSETGTSYTVAVGKATASVVMYSDGTDEYAYVTIGNNSAWFLVEPIRWIVGYGEDEPTSYDVAVSVYVLTCGNVVSSVASSGWDWTSSTLLDSVADLESATSFTIASEASWGYDAFVSTVGQSFVTDDASTATSVISVASVAEIDALGGTYKTQCSDFVAFLLSGGTTTSGYVVDYWTRDLAYELDASSTYGSKYGASSYQGYYNSGVYVGADGLISNAWLSEVMGARLSVTLG